MVRPEYHEAASRVHGQRWVQAGGRVATAAALLLLGTVVIPATMPGVAWAETHEDEAQEEEGHEDGEHGGGGGGGKGGSHEGGHDDPSHDESEGGHEESEGGKGRGPQAGREEDGGGRGQGAGASGGGRPVWAKGGIPEVELGRLNVARAPGQVLDRAYAEALSTFSEEIAAFYRLDLAAMEQELATNWGNVRIIDSPLQNLALLRDALDGRSALQDVGITTDNDTLLAVFLGTASDKSVPVTTETALAISTILGHPLSATEAAALAEEAERIRQAILKGHG